MEKLNTKETKAAFQDLIKSTRKLIDATGTMGLLWLKEEVDKRINKKISKGDKKSNFNKKCL
jgi:Cys-tRNA synthase (O-phospho-L-seryl-tRNA:Cys-tRNA synthase)